MIDADGVAHRLALLGLDPWAAIVPNQLERFFGASAHGDWPRWQAAIDSLPELKAGGGVDADEGAVSIRPGSASSPAQQDQLADALRSLHPWRKGPFRIADVFIDSEWRSNWKWDRLHPNLEPLDGRLVLDVGCGNGYYAWRLALAGASQVFGIDPTAVFVAQYLAIRKLVRQQAPGLADRVELLPVGIDDVPPGLRHFDTVLSMGVLYHRRSPIDHLLALHGMLRPGGQLLLETLVVDDGEKLLVPSGRYAKMRNVWFLPSPGLLAVWLHRAGFRNVATVDVTPTTVDEQRRTSWMHFESLADFLDPADTSLTCEGYPAPQRAIVTAIA